MKLNPNIAIYLTAFAALSACGGGSTQAPQTVTSNPPPLSVYVGTWQGDCVFHEQETAIMTMPSTATGAIEVNLRTDYFDNTNCTGVIRGTSTQSANLSITFVKSIDTFAVLAPNGALTAIRAEQINASSPASFDTLTGVGVQNVIKNGKAQWCISFSNGDSSCINNDGLSPARSGSGAMYLRNNEMFLLSPSGTNYSVDQRFTRK